MFLVAMRLITHSIPHQPTFARMRNTIAKAKCLLGKVGPFSPNTRPRILIMQPQREIRKSRAGGTHRQVYMDCSIKCLR